MKRQSRSARFMTRSALALLAMVLGMTPVMSARAEPNQRRLTNPAEVVAVLPFETVGASALEVAAVTDRLRDELVRSGKFVIMHSSDVAFAATCWPGPLRSREPQGGNAEKTLGAQKWVCGRITRLDETHWLIAAELVDFETGQTLRSSSVPHEGTFFDLLRVGIPALVERFTESDSSLAVLDQPVAPPLAIPKRGWGIFGGIATRTGTLKLDHGGELKYTADGLHLGGSYQWVIAPHWSVAAIFQGIGGETGGEMSAYYTHNGGGMFGAQVRYWFLGGGYIGGELGSYTTSFDRPVDRVRLNTEVTMMGNGAGIVIGYQGTSGGFAELTRSSERLTTERGSSTPRYFYGKAEESMTRVSFGYRW